MVLERCNQVHMMAEKAVTTLMLVLWRYLEYLLHGVHSDLEYLLHGVHSDLEYSLHGVHSDLEYSLHGVHFFLE